MCGVTQEYCLCHIQEALSCPLETICMKRISREKKNIYFRVHSPYDRKDSKRVEFNEIYYFTHMTPDYAITEEH